MPDSTTVNINNHLDVVGWEKAKLDNGIGDYIFKAIKLNQYQVILTVLWLRLHLR